MSRVLALSFLGLVFGFPARATESIYQNFSVLNYTIPGYPPPMIDASNFDNENQFNVTFNNYSPNYQFYEPENTINYTNNSTGINTGIMTVNTVPPTNGDFVNENEVGVGFQFDTQTTNILTHQMAGTFYNSGTIRCDSILDGNNLFGGNVSLFDFGFEYSFGQCLVWATNIFCPGTIETSENGFIGLTGQHVDLHHSLLLMEQGFAQGLSPTNVDASVNSEGAGYDTNAEWNPSFDLTPTNALSSLPDGLYLTNSTPYFQILTSINPGVSTNVLVRAVFIQNDNTNVSYTTYVAPSLFGNDGALLQWTGTFVDPATGQTSTNNLYLFHYYFNSTNFLPIVTFNTTPQNGIEEYQNYVWDQTSALSPGNVTAPGFQNVFNDSNITNIYEFFNSQLAGTTAGTNVSTANPSGALTNLPARIQIAASQDLNLSNAIISGENYLSLMASNQFDGNGNAQIVAPYSDINLGVTNGYLAVSNLLEGNIFTWSGTLNEWSTRWTNVDANGISWDYRVMLVESDLKPTLEPQVQNLTLTTTNLLVSDVLNVFGPLYTSAQSLTLTTNAFGVGAHSLDGELNLQNQNPFTWSWNSSFPNLLWLTNDGAIRMANLSDFVGSTQAVQVTPGSAAISASGQLVEAAGTNVATNTTVTIAGVPYVYVGKLNNTVPYQVMVASTFDGSMSNLIAAINAGAGGGKNYSAITYPNPAATAGLLAGGAFVVSANANNYPGTYGNSIAVAVTGTNLTWATATNRAVPISYLQGGADAVQGATNTIASSVPYGAIINDGLMTDQGSTLWANNFMNGGVISNGVGSFLLNAQTATLTNGSLTAGGDVSITANTLEMSNLVLQAGRTLTLQVTNWLTDDGVSNANIWSVGSTNGTGGNGLMLPILPTNTTPSLNNLLGTTISVVCPPPNKDVSSTWAGLDYGASTLGYDTNNVAIGQLILNSLADSSTLSFNGTGVSNAIYVDRLVLENYASLANGEGSGGIPTLSFNNLVIYYADAVSSSTVTGGPLLEVSHQLNNSNGGHLRWVPQYAGYFSSTNMVYPNGSTNTFNIGLVTSPYIDSNGNGIPNAFDSQPLFVSSQVDFKFALTNVPPEMAKLTWNSIPGATNFIYYAPDLTNMDTADWNVITNFVSPSAVPPVGGWPITNTLVLPLNLTNPHGYYRVGVVPNAADVYGQ